MTTQTLTDAPARTYEVSDADLDLMLMIRAFEQCVLERFAAGELSGTAHTCIGQEYIPVALAPLLREDDFVVSNHRGHGHYLAWRREPAPLLAEIMGLDSGVCRGHGGSQHVYDGRFLSTGVQAEGIAVACGIAWTFARARRGQICVAYIGDGTFGRGAVYEALNLARIHRLPLLVVVENNEIAISTRRADVMAGAIGDRFRAFDWDYIEVTSREPGAIRAQLRGAVARLRQGAQRPLAVECHTERLVAHSKGDDTRSAGELAQLRARGWYEALRRSDGERLARHEWQAKARLAQTLERLQRERDGAAC